MKITPPHFPPAQPATRGVARQRASRPNLRALCEVTALTGVLHAGYKLGLALPIAAATHRELDLMGGLANVTRYRQGTNAHLWSIGLGTAWLAARGVCESLRPQLGGAAFFDLADALLRRAGALGAADVSFVASRHVARWVGRRLAPKVPEAQLPMWVLLGAVCGARAGARGWMQACREADGLAPT